MFDKIWFIDQDGYLIFNGEPSRSLSFFKESGLFPYYFIQNRLEQVSPEDVIKIVETKKIQSDGNLSDERLVSPKLWYEAWRTKYKSKIADNINYGKALPISVSRLPGIEKQFILYLIRNFRLRFLNFGYLLFHLFIIPLLGVSLALIIRNMYKQQYTLGENEYLPLFIFLSIIILLFSGLLSSVEETFHEKKRIKRDISLNISKFSYQNAKIAYLFLLSGLQSILYVLLTNKILGIQEMLVPYFLNYFSILVFGNILGLILSDSIRKLNISYILIPFILLPNIIFGGYTIPYGQNRDGVPGEKNIPVLANFIPTRYAYEALLVNQFSSNKYNKYFFQEDKKLYDINFISNHTLPLLGEKLEKARFYLDYQPQSDSFEYVLKLLKNEIAFLGEREEIAPFDQISRLDKKDFDYKVYDDVFGYLTYIRFLSENLISEHEMQKLKITNLLLDSLKDQDIEVFRRLNHNYHIENLLTQYDDENIIISDGKMYKSGKAVYLDPVSKYGESHFFASRKRILKHFPPTMRYNLSAIWIMNLTLYIIFLWGILNVFLNLFRIEKNQ